MHTLLFFAHGMQVEVPKCTVLCFNHISLSPERMSVMSGVHFEIGGIISETKKAVLKKVSGTFFLDNIHMNRENQLTAVHE